MGHDGDGDGKAAAQGESRSAPLLREQAVLFQLAFDQGEGELGRRERDVELGEDPGKAADVVLVAVGENDGANVFAILREIADIGDDDVDAKELFFGEHQAGIDDDDVILPP